MSVASAAVYRVGPGEKYTKVSEVAARLKGGDEVEITGDISDNVTLSTCGAPEKQITVRGVTHLENDRIVRPQVTSASPACPFIIKVSGDWYVIEGIALTGFKHDEYGKAAAVYAGKDLVLRNCHFHHNARALVADEALAGDMLLEFCEFDSNGYTRNPTSLCSAVPAARLTVQHSFFHDNIGGNLLRTGFARNVIRYNWFENQRYFALQITTPEFSSEREGQAVADRLLPTHSDVVANVFASGWHVKREDWSTHGTQDHPVITQSESAKY